MANLEWHTKELNKIRSGMQRQQKTGKTGQAGHSQAGHGREQAATDVSRSRRTSPLLQRLRRARRVKGDYEPDMSDGFYDSLSDSRPPKDPRDQSAVVKWAQRSAMYALVPLSLIGTATLFVVGFVGSHMVVEYMVGTEYLPTSVTASREAAPKIETVAPAPVTPVREAAPVTPVREAAPVPVRGRAGPRSRASPRDRAGDLDKGRRTACSGRNANDGTRHRRSIRHDEHHHRIDPAGRCAGTARAEHSGDERSAPGGRPTPSFRPNLKPPVETAPAKVAPEPVAPEPEVTATKPIVRSLVESVFGLGESSKPAEEAPAVAKKAPVVKVEPAGATVNGDAPQAAEPAANQQAALTINQPDEAQAQSNPALPDVYRVSREEAVRMFGEGQSLMAAGDIRQARGLFARSLASGMPEAALALGRSYDPKYIARIQNANAAPDAEAARNWYEEWYRQSVEQGSISSDVRLDRLLHTMNAK